MNANVKPDGCFLPNIKAGNKQISGFNAGLNLHSLVS